MGDEQIRIIYRIGPVPFVEAPGGGDFARLLEAWGVFSWSHIVIVPSNSASMNGDRKEKGVGNVKKRFPLV